MRIATRRVYVVECPRCSKPIDWSGEGGVWFPTKKMLLEHVENWRGCEPSMSLTEWCGCTRLKAKAKP